MTNYDNMDDEEELHKIVRMILIGQKKELLKHVAKNHQTHTKSLWMSFIPEKVVSTK